MLTTILTILAQLVPTILANTGVIGAGTQTIIQNLTAPVATLLQNLSSGQTKVEDGLAALAAMAGVVAVLKANTNLPQTVLTEIANIDSDIQAALKAYVTAEGGLDLTKYQPIPQVA